MARESYAQRIARLLAQGFTKSQARGHAKPTELSVKLERILASNPGNHPELAVAKRSKNKVVTTAVTQAYKSTGYTRPDMAYKEPLFIQANKVISNYQQTGSPEVEKDGPDTGVKGLVEGAFVHVENEFLIIVKRRLGKKPAPGESDHRRIVYYVLLLPQGEEVGGPFNTETQAIRHLRKYARFLQGQDGDPNE